MATCEKQTKVEIVLRMSEDEARHLMQCIKHFDGLPGIEPAHDKEAREAIWHAMAHVV